MSRDAETDAHETLAYREALDRFAQSLSAKLAETGVRAIADGRHEHTSLALDAATGDGVIVKVRIEISPVISAERIAPLVKAALAKGPPRS